MISDIQIKTLKAKTQKNKDDTDTNIINKSCSSVENQDRLCCKDSNLSFNGSFSEDANKGIMSSDNEHSLNESNLNTDHLLSSGFSETGDAHEFLNENHNCIMSKHMLANPLQDNSLVLHHTPVEQAINVSSSVLEEIIATVENNNNNDNSTNQHLSAYTWNTEKSMKVNYSKNVLEDQIAKVPSVLNVNKNDENVSNSINYQQMNHKETHEISNIIVKQSTANENSNDIKITKEKPNTIPKLHTVKNVNISATVNKDDIKRCITLIRNTSQVNEKFLKCWKHKKTTFQKKITWHNKIDVMIPTVGNTYNNNDTIILPGLSDIHGVSRYTNSRMEYSSGKMFSQDSMIMSSASSNSDLSYHNDNVTVVPLIYSDSAATSQSSKLFKHVGISGEQNDKYYLGLQYELKAEMIVHISNEWSLGYEQLTKKMMFWKIPGKMLKKTNCISKIGCKIINSRPKNIPKQQITRLETDKENIRNDEDFTESIGKTNTSDLSSMKRLILGNNENAVGMIESLPSVYDTLTQVTSHAKLFRIGDTSLQSIMIECSEKMYENQYCLKIQDEKVCDYNTEKSKISIKDVSKTLYNTQNEDQDSKFIECKKFENNSGLDRYAASHDNQIKYIARKTDYSVSKCDVVGAKQKQGTSKEIKLDLQINSENISDITKADSDEAFNNMHININDKRTKCYKKYFENNCASYSTDSDSELEEMIDSAIKKYDGMSIDSCTTNSDSEYMPVEDNVHNFDYNRKLVDYSDSAPSECSSQISQGNSQDQNLDCQPYENSQVTTLSRDDTVTIQKYNNEFQNFGTNARHINKFFNEPKMKIDDITKEAVTVEIMKHTENVLTKDISVQTENDFYDAEVHDKQLFSINAANKSMTNKRNIEALCLETDSSKRIRLECPISDFTLETLDAVGTQILNSDNTGKEPQYLNLGCTNEKQEYMDRDTENVVPDIYSELDKDDKMNMTFYASDNECCSTERKNENIISSHKSNNTSDNLQNHNCDEILEKEEPKEIIKPGHNLFKWKKKYPNKELKCPEMDQENVTSADTKIPVTENESSKNIRPLPLRIGMSRRARPVPLHRNIYRNNRL